MFPQFCFHSAFAILPLNCLRILLSPAICRYQNCALVTVCVNRTEAAHLLSALSVAKCFHEVWVAFIILFPQTCFVRGSKESFSLSEVVAEAASLSWCSPVGDPSVVLICTDGTHHP